MSAESRAVHPFEVSVDEAVLVDLGERLRRTRWPQEIPGLGWSYGMPVAYMKALTAYWADTYDWRRAERLLNSFPQFTTRVDGLDIHFIHQPSPRSDAIPLILTHGWPGSFYEFHKIVGPLSDPGRFGYPGAPAFHVVCPSLPGHGFSGKPVERGWDLGRTARAWGELMARLGYDRYIAQGGDWGSLVSIALGEQDPACIGVHVNIVMAFPPVPEVRGGVLGGGGQPEADPAAMTEQEKSFLEATAQYVQSGMGYVAIQSTRPQTLAFGLTDSPVGQAAWIIEKFAAWSDCGGDPETVYSRDELLDSVMIYWVTGTNASAARFYAESLPLPEPTPLAVPVGCSDFPKELFRSSRRWAEARFGNVVSWREHPAGGHFAAMEQPEFLVEDIRDLALAIR